MEPSSNIEAGDTAHRTFPSKERFRYPPVGTCIYCGAGGGDTKLSEEHIVPFGLNGTLVLPEASCSACAKVTGALVERIVLRNMFLTLRTIRNIPSRNPRERPQSFPVLFDFGTREETIDVPVEDHPFIATLPLYALALSLQGFPLGPLANPAPFQLWHNVDFKEVAKKYGANCATVTSRFDAGMFNRMLAKIAHSYAVAEFGLDGFRPLLVAQILGTWSGLPNYYVGGGSGPLVPAAILHDLSLELRTVGTNHFIVARIRLFADLGAPTYYVVAGKLDSPELPGGCPFGRFQQAREDVTGPQIENVGVYRISAIHPNSLIVGSWYFGTICTNCSRRLPMFDDISNGHVIPNRISGDGLLHAACPYCSASRYYIAKTIFQFQHTREDVS